MFLVDPTKKVYEGVDKCAGLRNNFRRAEPVTLSFCRSRIQFFH
jgi:hypothetical protein